MRACSLLLQLFINSSQKRDVVLEKLPVVLAADRAKLDAWQASERFAYCLYYSVLSYDYHARDQAIEQRLQIVTRLGTSRVGTTESIQIFADLVESKSSDDDAHGQHCGC